MHASIVRIITDAGGGSRFEDAADALAPADFAPPAPPLAVHLEDTTGTGHTAHVLPGDDWVAFVVVE